MPYVKIKDLVGKKLTVIEYASKPYSYAGKEVQACQITALDDQGNEMPTIDGTGATLKSIEKANPDLPADATVREFRTQYGKGYALDFD